MPASQKAPSSEPWLRNRLRQHSSFWSAFCTSAFILSVITTGYQLPWAQGPPPPVPCFKQTIPLPSSFLSLCLRLSLANLVVTGAAHEVAFCPFIVSPLGVVPKGIDKLRLIQDLRYVNSFLKVDFFRYENVREVSSLCKLREFLFTVDLKSGYHHVDIHPDFWQFLGFEWEGKYYVFTQLPFGLATACFDFTKLIKQLVQRWRSFGIRPIPYIDDFLFFASSPSEFVSVKAQVLEDSARAGFVLSHEKCQLQLSHVAKFLGFIVDTLHGVFCLSARQKDKLRDNISACLSDPQHVPAKLLAKVTGLLASMSLVTGTVSGLFSRFLHRALATRTLWRGSVSLDSSALAKLAF